RRAPAEASCRSTALPGWCPEAVSNEQHREPYKEFSMTRRRIRRMVGVLNARLPELRLDLVPDPRGPVRRWRLSQLLSAALLGLMSGCRSLLEAERLTDSLAPSMRRTLGLPRRVADTTMRDILCRMPLGGLREVLHRLVH